MSKLYSTHLVTTATAWGVMLPRVSATSGPGDVSGDGKADILACDSGGSLWLYRGIGKSGWLPRVKVGGRWNAMTAVL